MTSQFSPKVSEILAYSREEAARLASSSVAPEHLLLGLLRMKDGPVIDVFRRLNVDLRLVKAELEDRVVEEQLRPPVLVIEAHQAHAVVRPELGPQVVVLKDDRADLYLAHLSAVEVLPFVWQHPVARLIAVADLLLFPQSAAVEDLLIDLHPI